MDVDADCAYTGFVQHDVTSLLHEVMHTVVIVMTTVMPNPRFCKFRGHIILFKDHPNDKKHLAREWQDLIFQEDLKSAIVNLEKHCTDPNHPYDQVVRYKHKTGSTVWIRCRGLAIRDEKGNVLRMLGAHTDITELKESEKEISRLSNEYEIVFNGTQDAMSLIRVLKNGEFRFIRNNLSHQKKTGLLLQQFKDKTPQELFGKEKGDLVARNYQKCVDNRKSITYEETVTLNGETRIWATKVTPIMEGDDVTHLVISSDDITERKNLEATLQAYANHDALTGLPNRRLFFERLDQIVEESRKNDKKFAILYIDLDGFKAINDTYGHEVGDGVLIAVGNRLSKLIRKTDVVARLGGDEFAIAILDIEELGIAEHRAQKILETLKETIVVNTLMCTIDSSIGIAIFPDAGADGETLLRNADSAMYEVKKKRSGGIGFTSLG